MPENPTSANMNYIETAATAGGGVGGKRESSQPNVSSLTMGVNNNIRADADNASNQQHSSQHNAAMGGHHHQGRY